MSDLLREDAAARWRALEPASFIVEAPAGAGKTELLTQRTLRLLALVDHPEEVVALTFTNKAATEMRDRLLGSLEMAAAGRRPGDEAPHRQITFDLGRAVLTRDAELGWQLLQHPGRLAVTTLDALCAGLARQMPLLSRFGAQPGIAEEAEEHYRDAARRTLAMVEDGTVQADIVAAALDFVDNDSGRLERLLVAMLARREQWLQHTARTDAELRAEAEAGLAALVERDLAAAAAQLTGRWQSDILASARFAAATLAAEQADAAIAPLQDWSAPLSADSAALPQWRALAALLLTNEGTLRRALDKRIGLPPTPEGKAHKATLLAALGELGPAAEAALQRLRELPEPAYDDATWAAVETFSHLLNLASAQLWLVFQEAGAVDFSEIAQRALQALGNDEAPTDLALALDYRIRHLLVDEFQDTSPTQVRLIAALTRGWSAGDGRTLFLVGDPMQSIYRFRKADVGLFLKVREQGIGSVRPEKLRLYRNNRSRPALVDWVNREFPAVFPAVDDPLAGAVRYAESAATREDDATAGVFIHPLLDADGAAEAAQLLAVIEQTRQDSQDERIAVLVRARSHLDALVTALRQQAPELPFQAVETEALAGRQAIQDVLSLAHALLHRADRVHWLTVLRAPWCGLRLADLHALAADDLSSTIWSLLQDESRLARLSADGRRRLAPLLAAFREAFAAAGRQHPRRWIEGVWRQLGGPRCLTAPGDMQEIEALFALIDRLVASGCFSADTLANDAAELFAPPDPTPAAAGLQLMTIHKSKGLEFDTVLLPGLHRKTGSDDAPLLVWDEIPLGRDGDECLIAAPMPPRGDAAGTPSIYRALRQQEKDRSHHESERLLYVAATRARRALHLFGTVVLKDEQLGKPPTDSLLALLWPGEVGAAFAAALENQTPTSAAAAARADADFVPLLVRLPSEALAKMPEAPAGISITRKNPEQPAEDGKTLDTDVGTLVHRCLELIARQGVHHWSAERIDRQLGAYRHWLRARGHASEAADAGTERVAAALRTALASPAGRWLLDHHDEDAAELALCSHDEIGTALHVVDRTFVTDGCRWIIDYKIVRCESSEPGEFLQTRAEEYRPQLERYAGLFAGEPYPLRMAIYFVEQGVLLETPHSGKPC